MRTSSLTRWRLARPSVVTRYAARGEPRSDVSHDDRFQLSVETAPGVVTRFPIQDISTHGLSFTAPDNTLKSDRRLTATLHLPACPEHPVMLELRHCKPQGDGFFYGTELRGISQGGAADLRRACRRYRDRS